MADLFTDIYAQVEQEVKNQAPAIQALYRDAVKSRLKRRTSKAARGFAPRIRKDGIEVWGLSVSTLRYVYMHHHGMQPQRVVRRGRTYLSKGYAKLSLLTPPGEQGAKILADALTPLIANVVVKSVF
jgi:hypothetical protein